MLRLALPSLLLALPADLPIERPVPTPPAEDACARLEQASGAPADAAPLLHACLSTLQPGASLALVPGVYTLRTTLVIDRPVTLTTRGLAADAPGCRADGDPRCAMLAIGQIDGAATDGAMPVEITAPNVTLSHLVIRGAKGIKPARDKRLCADPRTRPLGGGIRVRAAGFMLARSVVRDMACYTAIEMLPGVDRPVVRENIIGPNGDHRPGERWADGVTIHDATNAIFAENSFFDNTDVQLIFGGCRDCTVTGNVFRHGGSFAGSSFAELMIHSWPHTSGAYDGSVFSNNDVDCGAAIRCGFGILVGANPWYPGKASGGTVKDNRVKRAMIGLNVDGLTGPVTFGANAVSGSGGRFGSGCGTRTWPAVNIAPASRGFVRGAMPMAGSLDTRTCLLNRKPR